MKITKLKNEPIFQGYDEFQLKRLSKTIYIIMGFGLIAFVLFAYFDIKNAPELIETILVLRGASCIPLILIAYLLYTEKCDKYIPKCILVIGSVPMFIIMYLHTIIDGEIYFVPLTTCYFLLVIISLTALFSKLQLFLAISTGLILSNFILFFFDSDHQLFLMGLMYKSIGVYLFSLVITFKIRDVEVEGYRLAKELHKRSLVDPLTQAFNRLGLKAWFDSVKINHKGKFRVSLFMLDIDNFKMVNDQHGHQTGDSVIKDFARVLRSQIPSSSCVVRYGGEEFIVVIKNLTHDESVSWANSMLEKIQSFEFCNTENIIFNVTTSIGVAQNIRGDDNLDKLIQVADKNLYKAKKGGRNKVVY